MQEIYTREFYECNGTFSDQSAPLIVNMVVNLFRPKSVVDIGCSTGQWLKAFTEAGVRRCRGFDGSWVPQDQLLIPKPSFTAIDLSVEMPVIEGFDLATCLEVAEHLPFEVSARLVDCLTKAAPVVVFSAAIPGQPGTNHINTQWPWFWQHLFRERKFTCVDSIRPAIAYDSRVAWFYRQNIMCFISDEALPNYPALAPFLKQSDEKWVLMPIAQRILKARVEKLETYAANALLRALLHKVARKIGFRPQKSESV